MQRVYGNNAWVGRLTFGASCFPLLVFFGIGLEGSAIAPGGGDSLANFVDRLTVRDHEHHVEVGRDKLEGDGQERRADDVDVGGVALDDGDEDLAAFLSGDGESGSDMVAMFTEEGSDGGHNIVEHVVSA